MKQYIVGGWVRDSALKELYQLNKVKYYKEPHDRDYVVVGSTPEEMLSLGYKQVGNDFPVFLHSETGEEYALARKEISTGSGYQDFKFDFSSNIDLKSDLRRRDFTINALAKEVKSDGTVSDKLVDYFNGLKDLQEGNIRHIDAEHFREDPLRVLRACRQAVELQFNIDSSTVMLCRRMVKDRMLESLSAERIWKEVEKALHTYCVSEFIEFLGLTNALYYVLPEVHALLNIPENVEYHPEGNTYSHVLLTLNQVKYHFIKEGQTLRDLSKKELHNMSLVNFAMLCHDLGKANTRKEDWPAHHGHDELGLPIIDELCDRLKVPNEYRDFAKLFCKYHMKFYEFLKSHRKKHYDMVKVLSNGFKNKEQLKLILICHKCDILGREGKISEDRVVRCKNTCDEILKIYDIMTGITLTDLPEETQKNLLTQTGEKFGKLYRDAMISYLKHNLSLMK